MENWILTITNLPISYPLALMWKRNDFKSFTLLSGLGICSIVSHLGECHRKGMSGALDFSDLSSWRWNKADQVGTYLIISRLIYLFWKKNVGSRELMINNLSENRILFLFFSLAGFALRISEWTNSQPLYLLLHSIWHISVYPIMAQIYKKLC